MGFWVVVTSSLIQFGDNSDVSNRHQKLCLDIMNKDMCAVVPVWEQVRARVHTHTIKIIHLKYLGFDDIFKICIFIVLIGHLSVFLEKCLF